MNDVEVRNRTELAETEGTPGIVRRVAFETENNVMVEASVAAGATSGWHHHADRHTYGYVVAGETAAEYGPGGRDTFAVSAGDCYYVAPGVVHRGHNPTDADSVIVESFVGSGPLVVNVDGPEPG